MVKTYALIKGFFKHILLTLQVLFFKFRNQLEWIAKGKQHDSPVQA